MMNTEKKSNITERTNNSTNIRKNSYSRKGKQRRHFTAIILLLMALLTVGTVVFAANGKWEKGSYSLVIEKKFDFDSEIPDEVKTKAKDQKYTFKIEGTRINEERVEVPVNDIVTLPRDGIDGDDAWKSETFTSAGPFNVTVTEITDNIEIWDDNDNYYNMSDSSSDANVTINSRKHELKLRSNSIITIKLPLSENENDRNTPVGFHITSRSYNEHNFNGFIPLNETFSLYPGEERKITEVKDSNGNSIKLPAGIYTIEQIMAPDGFFAKLGERTAVIGKGKEGKFYINGATGRLTLTAEGNKGDGKIHYFVISSDNENFTERMVEISSGESHIADNLPKGVYTVTERSLTENANTQYSVTVPQTDVNLRKAQSSAISYTSSRSWKSFPVKGDYIQFLSFGPLYNANNQKITDKQTKYYFHYGIGNGEGQIVRKSVSGGPFVAPSTYTMNNPPKLVSETGLIYFSATDVTSETVKKIDVSWNEYTEKEKTNTYDKADKEYTNLTIDERGWIKIMAPAISNVSSASDTDNIIYYYKIRDNQNNLISGPSQGFGATDRADTTVKLKAGESITLTGLKDGNYKITEMVDWDHASFTMQVVGDILSITEAKKELNLSIAGKRMLMIGKPEIPPLSGVETIPENTKQRKYQFQVNGPNSFYQIVDILAGTNTEIELPEAGSYTITPVNDKPVEYQINYTDSGAIYGTAKGSNATVTFTNSFKAGKYGYRYIHEYYIKEEDGSYTFVGNSNISTVRGRSEGEHYQALDISQVPSFKGNNYQHFDEAYGWVDPLEPKTERFSTIRQNATSSNAIPRNTSLRSATPSNTRLRNTISKIATSSNLKRNSRDFVEAINEKSDYKPYTSPYKGILVNGGTGIALKPSDNTSEQEKRELNYAPVGDKDQISVTEDASEIIILRYYRERQPKGSYNVIHVYYFRDSDGDHWEGSSNVLLQEGELGIKYTADAVDKQPSFQPNSVTEPYTYCYINRPEYGVLENSNEPTYGDGYTGDGRIYRSNDTWSEIEGTKAGEQIIILKYYRELSMQTKKSYNVVHEYYLREKNESSVSDENNTITDEIENTPAIVFYKAPNNDDESYFGGTLENDDKYTYTFEGISEISEKEPLPEDLDKLFTNEDVESEFTHTALDGKKRTYDYLNAGYGYKNEEGFYGYVKDKPGVEATEEGDEIIILRYYREETKEPEKPTPEKPDPTPEVSYNYVHEYYLKHPDGSLTLEGKSDIGTVPNADADKEYTGEDVSRIPDYKGTTYTYYECGYGNVSDSSYKEDEGKKFVKATESGDQIIILRYYREESTKDPDPSPKVSYKYIHEYYFKHPDGSLTLEGKSDIGTVPDAKAGVEYNYKNVTQVPDYEGKTYTYFNCGYGAMFSDKDYSELPDKTFIYATESGEQIIILRYEREEKPDDPKPSGGGGRKHSDPDPKPTPAPTTVPEPVPEVPTVPVVESVPETSPVPEPDTPVLPDPNLPGSPERITIMDGGVPKTYIKVWNPTTEEYVYLEEDDVPLTGLNDPSLPRTSDNTNFFLWISLVSSSLGGIIIIGYRRFRKEH